MQLFETPTVTSDINGHHVKDQDGKTIQSFPRSPEGLKASKQYMYKHHKNLSVSQKKSIGTTNTNATSISGYRIADREQRTG